jgi:hypothetical protein
MKTIVTITIENPDPEILKALLQGNANKQSAVITTREKVEKPKKAVSNSLKGKHPITKDKKCIDCKNTFHPRCNVQKRCDTCADILKHPKKRMKLEPIEDTIKEIEQAQKERVSKPYVFSN